MLDHLHTKLALSTNVLYRNIIGRINLTNAVNVTISSMTLYSLYIKNFYQVVKLAKISPGGFNIIYRFCVYRFDCTTIDVHTVDGFQVNA